VADQRYLIRHHRRALRTIENRVLEEVSIQRAWRAVGSALAVVLACAASVWWLEVIGRESPHAAKTVSGVGVGALLVASVISAVALRLRRYRWCCIAANCGGLAAVIGIGVFWWVRTGQAEIGLLWLVVADLVTVTLTVGWIAVILTPIEHSQPDMRRRFVHTATRNAK
jgi:hypothetical protein